MNNLSLYKSKKSYGNNVVKKTHTPSPLKKERMMKELGFEEDLFELSDVSSDSSDDQLAMIDLKELERIDNNKSEILIKNSELQKKFEALQKDFEKEVKMKKTRMIMVQKACSDTIADKNNLVLDLQDCLEEKIKSSKFRVLVDRIEELHKDKASLHDQLITAQIEFEERIQDEIFMKCPRCSLVDSQDDKIRFEEEIDVLRNELEQKQKLNHEMESQLEVSNKIKNENCKLKEELEDQKEKIQNKKSKIKRLKEELKEKEKIKPEEIVNLELKIKSNESKNIDLNERLILEKEENKKLNETLTNLKEDLKMFNIKKKIDEKKTSKLNEEKMLLEEKFKELQMKIDSESDESNSMLKKQQEENKQLLEQLQSEQKSKIELEKEVEDREERANLIFLDFEEACKRIKQLQIEADESRSEARVEMIKNEEQLMIQIRKSDEEHMELTNRYQQLNEKSHKDISELCEEIKTFKRSSLKELEKQDDIISHLQLRLTSSTEKLKLVEENQSKVQNELKYKNHEVEDLMEALKSTNEKFKDQNEKIQHLEDFCKSKENFIEDLNSKLTIMQNSSESVKEEFQKLQSSSEIALNGKKDEIDLLEERLNAAEDSLRGEIEKRLKSEKHLRENEEKITKLMKRIENLQESSKKLIESKESEVRDLLNERIMLKEDLTFKESLLKQIFSKVLYKIRDLGVEFKTLCEIVEEIPEIAKQYSNETLEEIKEELIRTQDICHMMSSRYRKEMQTRKKLHNELVELKGNIRVFVRVRPKIPEDKNSMSLMLSYDEDDDSLIYVNNQRGKNLKFEVDKIFTPTSTQQDVYKEVKSLVTSCLDGYNVCIFAYGQTGSGKTYTMEGTESNRGINQRALFDLFSIIEQRSFQWEYEVSVSLLEIYNESLRDLLSSSSEKLDIRMNPDGTLKVSHLVDKTVKDICEVNELFEIGRCNRSTASTNMNEHSSRSHAVLIVNVVAVNRVNEKKIFGKLNLIDLAGSERVSKSGAEGDRLKEAQNINRSLSALGDVINALRNKQSHIPFRNSKLTYLLQDSLSKDSKTLMVVQVSPLASSMSETICSLNFAHRVQSVELGQANRKIK